MYNTYVNIMKGGGNMTVTKEYVTWQDVEAYVQEVANRYKDSNIPGVYGIPRGGLIYAVLISHKMHIPMLMSAVENCIIVDDIADTGETLIHYQNNSSGDGKNKYHITTMYYREGSTVKPEYYYREKKDKWIVYPWENE